MFFKLRQKSVSLCQKLRLKSVLGVQKLRLKSVRLFVNMPSQIQYESGMACYVRVGKGLSQSIDKGADGLAVGAEGEGSEGAFVVLELKNA